MQKIVLVEDDEDIRTLTQYALETAGFTTEGYEDGNTFWEMLIASEVPPDLVLLDIMLPGNDGFSILKKLREHLRYADVPVIMLTARGGEADKVRGLNLGADDYVSKPFGVTELIARIKAVLRRGGIQTEHPKLISYKDLILDPIKRLVKESDRPVLLTFLEFELLHYLLLNTEIVLRRDKLMDAVWGSDFLGESRTVDMHIKTLRQKLGAAGIYIKTIRNVGYKIGE
jgi:two-component system alkaline phosphatase synthesis response regulator PhoP